MKKLLARISLMFKHNSSNILTLLSIFGVGITVYNAHQDTIKAEHALEDERYACKRRGIFRKLDWKDKLRITWKCYIPTGVSAISTMSCIAGSHYCSHIQKEALSSAYLSSQALMQEYQKKVMEKIGENKEREVYDDAVKSLANSQAPTQLYSDAGIAGEVIDTGHGSTLFYDTVIPGGLYFKSDIGYLKNAKNEMNSEILNGEMYYDWNEILYRWGLPTFRYGSDRLITTEHLFNPKFTPEMMENGQVRILISYDLIPASEYSIR